MKLFIKKYFLHKTHTYITTYNYIKHKLQIKISSHKFFGYSFMRSDKGLTCLHFLDYDKTSNTCSYIIQKTNSHKLIHCLRAIPAQYKQHLHPAFLFLDFRLFANNCYFGKIHVNDQLAFV